MGDRERRSKQQPDHALARLRSWVFGIGPRLFGLMMVVSLITTFGVAMLQIGVHEQAERNERAADLQRIRDAHLDAIALALWNFDDAQLRLQLGSLLQGRHVAAVEVRDPDRNSNEGLLRLRVGDAKGPGLRVERLPLAFERNGERWKPCSSKAASAC